VIQRSGVIKDVAERVGNRRVGGFHRVRVVRKVIDGFAWPNDGHGPDVVTSHDRRRRRPVPKVVQPPPHVDASFVASSAHQAVTRWG